MEASPATATGGMSAPLAAIPHNLPARKPATSPAHPPSNPDPPLAPSADDLHGLQGACASPDSSEMATDLDGCMEESAPTLGEPRVYDDTCLAVEMTRVPTPDPELYTLQGSQHGQRLPPSANPGTAAALLLRARIMFTGGVGGPWSSGLGIASPKVTKGLVAAAADAISSLGWLPGARPAAVEAACGTLDRREALAYLIADAVLGVGHQRPLKEAPTVAGTAESHTAPIRKKVPVISLLSG